MSQASQLNAPFSFSRQFASPLDKSTVFSTIGDRDNFLNNAFTSGTAYAGMISVVTGNNTAYMLNSNRQWIPVGGNLENLTVGNITATGNANFQGDVTVTGGTFTITSLAQLATANISDIFMSNAHITNTIGGESTYSSEADWIHGNLRIKASGADFSHYLSVNGTDVSLSGHKHVWPDVTNFDSGVAEYVSTKINGINGISLTESGNDLNIGLVGEALGIHNLSTGSNGIVERIGVGNYITRTSGYIKSGLALDNVENFRQIRALGINNVGLSGRIPVWGNNNGAILNSGYLVSSNLNDDNTNTNQYIPLASAVKSYVDANLEANDAVVFKGTRTPSGLYPSGNAGEMWKFSQAGTLPGRTGALGPVVEVGDTLLCLYDNTPSGYWDDSVPGANPARNISNSWTILQTNINPNIFAIGTTTATTQDHFAAFVNTDGKQLKSAGFGFTSFNGVIIGDTNGIWTSVSSSTQGQILARNDDNSGYDFTSNPVNLTIDCGTY